jgi:hypothetical protein
VHLHVCVVNGVFEEVQGDDAGDAHDKATSANVIFHPASEIDESAVAQAQATLRKRILRGFVGRACWRALMPKRCWPTSTVASL